MTIRSARSSIDSIATSFDLASKVGASSLVGKALTAFQLISGLPCSSHSRTTTSFFSTWLRAMVLISLTLTAIGALLRFRVEALGLLQLVHEAEHDELRRTDGGDADLDDQAPLQHVLGGHRLAQPDMDVIGGLRRRAGQRAAFPQRIEVALDHAAHLEPGGGVVRLEHRE